MNIEELLYEDGAIYIKRKISKENYKNIFLNLKTKYKKYTTNFYKKYLNDTALILTTITFTSLIYTKIFESNKNITLDHNITLDDENVYLKLCIKEFYDHKIYEYSREQLEFLVNNKLEDLEKDVLLGTFNIINTDESFCEEIKYLLDKIIKLDYIIQDNKEKMKNGEVVKPSEIDSQCLLALFGEFAISVKKDLLKGDITFSET